MKKIVLNVLLTLFLSLSFSNILLAELPRVIVIHQDGTTEDKIIEHDPCSYTIVCGERPGEVFWLHDISHHGLDRYRQYGFRILSYRGAWSGICGGWYDVQLLDWQDKHSITTIGEPIRALISHRPNEPLQIGDEIYHDMMAIQSPSDFTSCTGGQCCSGRLTMIEAKRAEKKSPQLSYFNNDTHNITLVCSTPFMMMHLPNVSLLDNIWNFGFQILAKDGLDHNGWHIYAIQVFSDDFEGNRSILADNVLVRTPKALQVNDQLFFQVDRIEIGEKDRLIYPTSIFLKE